MEFKGLTSASHMSLQEAGYGSEEGQLGSEMSGAVSGGTTPGASRLQASQSQELSTTMQRLHQPAGTGGGRAPSEAGSVRSEGSQRSRRSGGSEASTARGHTPMILAAVFSQNSKSCIFRRAISSVHSSTVVIVFSQIFNKIMLSLELEPQINCRQLPRTRVSDSRPPCAIENRQKVHFFSQLEAK